ncbi:MAG TPA: FtsX-like permease family protein [Sedimentisphaerales bacterium]|nr:FtsX-like permease family protein [Sedimentisphaerales bacterium]
MYKIILAFRYLFRKRISYLAFFAVALCVFIVAVVMTVMRGLVTDFKQKNHRFVGDCVVGTESLVGFAYYEDFMKVLDGEDFVDSVAPVIKSYALYRRGSERSFGVQVMGIDAERQSRATGFGETLHYHKDDPARVFEPVLDSNVPGCVVGVDLWLSRDAKGRYSYGAGPGEESITVSCFPLTARGALEKAGMDFVNTKVFRCSDISQSGLARVDGSMVYVPFEWAQLLCGMGGGEKRVSAIYIKFRPDVGVNEGYEKVAVLWKEFVRARSGDRLANLLDQVKVQSWMGYRREFIAAMEKEQTMLIALFALLGVTTVFIVFVVFYMIVSHKSKDIGILKSVGASAGGVVRLFLGFAFLVGVLGSLVGLIFGQLFLLKINEIEGWLFEHFRFQLWDRTIYAIGDIPNKADYNVLLIITISAIFACVLGALIPSWQAARLDPVETLRVGQL